MEFDPLLADPTRLKILALLASCDWAEFSFVRDTAGLSKSALSKQVAKLETHEYVEVHKGYVGKFPRTSLRLTGTGRAAIENHLAALQQIVDQSRRHEAPE
ncbi:transcriptional regulator [Nocardiopsis sp. CT-R113]|uniref:Transcriptional regulator n=1 Tax=Nocardiopsis codii TaxID=3065942 RepID=A0ABU7K5Z5_9ACTN|nr:transcriptional regulator [Nocardiopsis sp. CT-R113]MEE2037630.1 transcriptional regulator [Nocardiopsis sp. CT-R113]